MDTAAAEARVKALTIRICVDHGVNATIKFGSARSYGGSQHRYNESHVHIMTYSRHTLHDFNRGRPWYSGYDYTMHLWDGYGPLVGADAEWALVLHEMAHAIDCERTNGLYGDRLNGTTARGQRQFHLAEFQTIVRELQAQYPRPGGVTDATRTELPPLDFSKVTAPVTYPAPRRRTNRWKWD